MTDEFYADRILDNGEDFDSEAIDTLAYDREGKRLYIEFVSGNEYVYSDVEESTFNIFAEADSIGRFYRQNIQGKFTSESGVWNVFRFPDADEDEVDLKPEQEWLSVPEGETPDFADGGVITTDEALTFRVGGNVSLSGGDMFTIHVPAVQPSKFGVKWYSEDLIAAGPFEPVFEALSEADALAQFNAQVSGIFGADLHVKIVSVTHYFD